MLLAAARNEGERGLTKVRDHGGGLDAAAARWGGARQDWLDLSTGVNPEPYPAPDIPREAWTALPDSQAQDNLHAAARAFWSVPDHLDILAAPGASALIARMPLLHPPAQVQIPTPTYNEHAAAFSANGWDVSDTRPSGFKVIVHPNNPDGRLWRVDDLADAFVVVDESFCDVAPEKSFVPHLMQEKCVVLKSFGKFWGLAGLRLGFAIGAPKYIAVLREALGPWPVSGPALRIGTVALTDLDWADATRRRLSQDSQRLDGLMTNAGSKVVGGTTLFRLYDCGAAQEWRDRLARRHIWTRVFPYSDTYLRVGLPASSEWGRLEDALWG